MNTPCNHWVTGLISNSTGFCPYCEIDQLRADVERLTLEKKAAAMNYEAVIEGLKAQKDGAYLERNKLVALLSKVFPSGKKKTAIEGWSEDWHGCVYIDLPTGQASWHYHDSQAELFAHLPEYQGTWDGHTTDEKYERIGGYLASGAAPAWTEERKQAAAKSAVEALADFNASGAAQKETPDFDNAEVVDSAPWAARKENT